MCPDCGSLKVTAAFADFGTCSQTGYQDAGELFQCGDCGARGPIEDSFDPPIARIEPQREHVAAVPTMVVVEQWDGAQFVERRLYWDAETQMHQPRKSA